MKSYSLINRLFLVLLINSLSIPFLYADIVITSGKNEPFLTPDKTGFYDIVLKEMFLRIGKNATTILLPSERSLINANTGINDGNVARIKGMEKKYKNLIIVPEKMIDYEFVAFTKNKSIKLDNWQSLKNYNIAYITGWKIFEKNVRQYKSLVKTQNAVQLFELLNKDRVDIILYDRWSGVWRAKQFSNKIHYIAPPIVTKNVYLYLHKKHRGIIGKLVKSLKSMKKDGTYQRMFNQTLI